MTPGTFMVFMPDAFRFQKTVQLTVVFQQKVLCSAAHPRQAYRRGQQEQYRGYRVYPQQGRKRKQRKKTKPPDSFAESGGFVWS